MTSACTWTAASAEVTGVSYVERKTVPAEVVGATKRVSRMTDSTATVTSGDLDLINHLRILLRGLLCQVSTCRIIVAGRTFTSAQSHRRSALSTNSSDGARPTWCER
eukprot:COSAG06_NODE_2551_length_6684_cov_3.568565_6_plen_107_part_00